MDLLNGPDEPGVALPALWLCRDGTDAGGFRRHGVRALATGPIQLMDASFINRRPGQPTAPGVAGGQSPAGGPGNLQRLLGQELARARRAWKGRQAERADRGALRHRLQGQRSELAPLLRRRRLRPQ